MKIIIKESQFNKLFEDIQSIKQDKFIKMAQEKHKDSDGSPLYDYSLVDYQGTQTKVKIICPKHKEEWKKITGNEYFEMTPNHHLTRGSKCKFCYLDDKIKYSDEDILLAAKKYKTASEFKTNDFAMWNAATKRGRELYDKVSAHFIAADESYGEQLTTEILVKKGLITEDCISNKNCDYREKTFIDCINNKKGKLCRQLRFDFYLPNQNTLIEYDGEQHFVKRGKYGEKFETRQENDKIKNKYCRDRGIKLIRIHYKVPFNEIEGSLLNALKSTKQEILIGPY